MRLKLRQCSTQLPKVQISVAFRVDLDVRATGKCESKGSVRRDQKGAKRALTESRSAVQKHLQTLEHLHGLVTNIIDRS